MSFMEAFLRGLRFGLLTTADARTPPGIAHRIGTVTR